MSDLVQLYLTAREFCWEGYYEDLLDLIEDNAPSTLQELGCVTDEEGKTLLHVAIMRRNIDIVLALVENEVLNPNAMEDYMQESTIVDDLSTIMLLVNKYYDVAEDAVFDCMFLAVELGHRNLVEYFHSANEETIHICAADTGMTPLHIAVKCNHVEVVKYLLYHTNANLSIKDKNGYIPENYAASDDMLDLFDYFNAADSVLTSSQHSKSASLDTSTKSNPLSPSTSTHSFTSKGKEHAVKEATPVQTQSSTRRRINLSAQNVAINPDVTPSQPRHDLKASYTSTTSTAHDRGGFNIKDSVRRGGEANKSVTVRVDLSQQQFSNKSRLSELITDDLERDGRATTDNRKISTTQRLQAARNLNSHQRASHPAHEFQSLSRHRRLSSPLTSPTINPSSSQSSQSPTAHGLTSPTSPVQRLSNHSIPSPTLLPASVADNAFDKYNVKPSKLPHPHAASHDTDDEIAKRQEMETLKTASKWEPFKLPQTNILKDLDVHELTPQEQTITATYFKMSKLGIPAPNIQQKMSLDGMHADLIRKVMKLLGCEDVIPAPLTADQQKSIVAQKKLIKLHWSAVDVVHPESFWKQMGNDAPVVLQGEDMESLEKIFSVQQAAPVIRPAKNANKHLPRVLDIQRANNIAIGLANFKDIGSNRLILNAVCSLDDLKGKLTVDRLLNLSSLLPTIPEAKAIRNITTFNKGELFAQLAVEYFPHIAGRLSCFLTMVQFSETKNSVLPKLEMLINCIQDIMQNKKLILIMQQLLAIGNTLNSSNAVSGFSISSLPRIIQMKGNDKKTSVLEFAIQMLHQKGHDDILSIVDELKPCIDKSSLLSLASLYSDITDIIKEFDEIREQLHIAEEYLEFYYQSATDSWLQAELLGKKYRLKKNDYVSTPYGDGRVIEIRKECVVIKPCKWLLLSEVQHMMYIHPSLVTVRSPFIVGDLVVCNHGSGVVKEISIVDNIAIITPTAWGKSSISTPKIYSPIVSLRPLINYEKAKMNTQSDMPILTHRFVDKLCNFAKLSQDSIKQILDLKASLQHHVCQMSKYFNEDPEKFDIIETLNVLKSFLNVIGKLKETKEAQERAERLRKGTVARRYMSHQKTKKNTKTNTPATTANQQKTHVPSQQLKAVENAAAASHRQFVRRMKYIHVGDSSSSSDSEADINKASQDVVASESDSESDISSVSSDDEMDGMIRLNQSVIRSGGFINHFHVPPSSVRKQVQYNTHRRKEPTTSNKRRSMAKDYVQQLEHIQQRKYIDRLPMYTYDERLRAHDNDEIPAHAHDSIRENSAPLTPKFQAIAMEDSSDEDYDDGTACMSELEALRSRITAASQPLPTWKSRAVNLMSSSESDSNDEEEQSLSMYSQEQGQQRFDADAVPSGEMESLQQITVNGVETVIEETETEEDRQRKAFFNSLNHLLDGLNLGGLSDVERRMEPVVFTHVTTTVPTQPISMTEKVKYDPEVEEVVIQCIQLRMDAERFMYDMDQVLAAIDAEYADIKSQADALCERIEQEQDAFAAEIRRRLDEELTGAYMHIEEVVEGKRIIHDVSELESESSVGSERDESPASRPASPEQPEPHTQFIPSYISDTPVTPPEFSGTLDDFLAQQAEENAHLASLMSRCQNLLTMSVAEICYEQTRASDARPPENGDQIVADLGSEEHGDIDTSDENCCGLHPMPTACDAGSSDLASLMSRCQMLLHMSVDEVCNSKLLSPQEASAEAAQSDNESTEVDTEPPLSLDMPDMASLMSRCSSLLNKSVDEICEELDHTSIGQNKGESGHSDEKVRSSDEFYMKLD